MTLRKTHDNSSGPRPGLTPIDDIHGSSFTPDHEPDSTTGKLHRSDDDEKATVGSPEKEGTKSTPRTRPR